MSNVPPQARPDDCQQIAISGIGGIGKTRLALEVAYKLREVDQGCSVFWVPATNDASFEAAYWEIGQKLRLPGMPQKPGRPMRPGSSAGSSPGQAQQSPASKDFKLMVKEALQGESCSRWLLIIDNMDDPTVFDRTVKPNLPFAHHGSILLTTRADYIVSHFNGKDAVRLSALDASAGKEMLQYDLRESQHNEQDSVKHELLEALGYNPLAIRTATNYMKKFNKNESQYLRDLQKSDASCSRVLSQDFEDQCRYDHASNPIARTWWVSFQQINNQQTQASKLLEIISFLGPHSIPKSILPDTGPRQDEALGILVSFGFIEIHDGEYPLIDAHRLV